VENIQRPDAEHYHHTEPLRGSYLQRRDARHRQHQNHQILENTRTRTSIDNKSPVQTLPVQACIPDRLDRNALEADQEEEYKPVHSNPSYGDQRRKAEPALWEDAEVEDQE